MGADGVTVNVYDSDWDWDQLLAQTSLGPDGYYDITFWYDDSEAPDIYIEFLAANSKVDLVHPSIWNTSYSWSTPTHEDYDGSQHQLRPAAPGLRVALRRPEPARLGHPVPGAG